MNFPPMAQIQGPTISTILTQVSCGSKGNVWGVDAAHSIYHYQSSDGVNWTHTQIPGGLSQVSVGSDGTVWGVNAAGNIERYNGNNSWTQIPGALKQVSVGADGTVWGVNPQGTAFVYNGSTWTPMPGHGQGANAKIANGNGTFTLVSVMSTYRVWALDTSSPDSSLWYCTDGNLPIMWSPFWDSTTITSCSFASDGSWAYIDQGRTFYQPD